MAVPPNEIGAAAQPAARMLVNRLAGQTGWFSEIRGGSKTIVPWKAEPEDFIAALDLLRTYGWLKAIEAAVGFAEHHQNSADARLAVVLSDVDAFAAKGHALLAEHFIELSERADGATAITHLIPVFVAKSWRGATTANIGGRSFPLGWHRLLVDHLPDPNAPFVGEAAPTPESSSPRFSQSRATVELCDCCSLALPPSKDRIDNEKSIVEVVKGKLGFPLTPRAAKERIKAVGVKIHRHSGRIWVDRASLENAALPARRNDAAAKLRNRRKDAD
jgi:hypothetical protein